MKATKKFLALALSASMVVSSVTFAPRSLVTSTYAEDGIEETLVTDFSYDFAYETAGYADGTIRIRATEDGVYKIFWGDENGDKLQKNGYDYTYLARVIVKDGTGSFNLISDYTAIPEGAKTVLVYRKDAKQYQYDIPEEKQFQPLGEGYTFGSLSDLHFGRYSTVYEDDAVPAVENAMKFFDSIGVDFVGTSGDLTAGGEQTSLDKYNNILKKYPDMTVLSCTGNHDSRITISSTDKNKLDTSIIRWYNSLTSKYFTVDEDGTITSHLKGHEVLASDALINPITTDYRETAGADKAEKEIPGLNFVTEAGGNIFIFFNEIAKTGETSKVDELITTGQMDWLAEQLETYKDKKIFLYFHSYLPVDTLNNDVVSTTNCTGDVKSDGGYTYNLDFKDVVTTSDGLNMQALFSKYRNLTMFSGHSHWQYSIQELNANLNVGVLKKGKGATLVHLSSVTEPRYLGRTDTGRTELNGEASEGSTVTTYENYTVYNSIDFHNSQYEAYATYLVPTGDDYEPVKNANYKEATDALVGDNYLEAEDMTSIQLLKSDYNLMLGAGYVYSSKGSENKDTTLTDGSAIGEFLQTKENKKGDQYVIVTLDGVQKVSNLKNFMLYFVNGNTDSKTFNIQLSLDGETYETVGTYTNMDYKKTVLDIDTTGLTLEEYKYIKLNLTEGAKPYGYQIREFAAIGYEKNETPNKAGSSSSLVEGTVDEEDYLMTDYNLLYGKDYTQSSVGNENGVGKLTDGKLSGGFVNTERTSSAQDQEFVVDLGKSGIQDVSNIEYFLLYFQNNMTNATAFNISVSLDGTTYEKVGDYTNVDIETTHFDPDLDNVTLEKFRYVKLHLTAGKTGYGYQIKEFALKGVEPMVYPEIANQSANVASAEKNLALKKTVYVSSTFATEGKDPTVLTDGKKDKYWSSDRDKTHLFEYVIVDLGEEYDTDMISSVLVNYKSNNTFCGDYTIEFSQTYNPEDATEGFYEVAKVKAASWEILQKYADSNGYVVSDVSDADPGKVRYVKLLMQGHKDYGFHVHEIAVLKSEKVEEVTTPESTTVTPETEPTTPESTTVAPETNPTTPESTTVAPETDDPIEVKGLVVESPEAGKISVNWEETDAQKQLGQTYKIYIDNEMVHVSITAEKVIFDVTEGEHTVKVIAVLGDKETPGVTATVEVEAKKSEEATGETESEEATGTTKPEEVTGATDATEATKVTDETEATKATEAIGTDGTTTGNTAATGGTTVSSTATADITAPTVAGGKKVAKPKIKEAIKKTSAKKASLTLKKVKGAKGYAVQVATSKKFTKKTIVKVKAKVKTKKKAIQVTITKLKANKVYYVRIRAYKKVNGKKEFGAWSKKKRIKNLKG